MTYDLIVLGGGPAGYLAAERAGQAGKKVLLIEKGNLGGVCLNEGCIPTKTLLYSAKIRDSIANGKKYGVSANDIELNHKKVVLRKNKIVKKLTAGVALSLKEWAVEVITGAGKIIEKVDDGFKISVEDATFTGKNLLIATGSSANIPPIKGLAEGLESGFVVTNREILNEKVLSEKLIVIGGGVIGLEMSSYFNSARSEVSVIEMMDRIGGIIDEEIANILLDEYTKKGVDFNLGCKVIEIGNKHVVYEKDGENIFLEADKVLISIGRTPNTKDIGLENIEVDFDRHGIKFDEHMQTNVKGVYVAGDVNGKSMLAHTAYREAEVALNNILGIEDVMRYNAIPAVIYTNPEVASVGISEQEAKKLAMDVTVKTLSMNYSGRYMAENEGGTGIIKIIVDNKTNTLTGVHIISNYASEIIYGAGIMIKEKINIDQIKKQVFPHPSVSEIIREAIFKL